MSNWYIEKTGKNTYTVMDEETAGAVSIAKLVVMIFLAAIFIYVAVIVFVIVGLMRLFKKMGYEGWKALIPFYGGYILYQEIMESGAMFLVETGSLIISVLLWAGSYFLGSTEENSVIMLLFIILSVPFMFIYFRIHLEFSCRLTRAFSMPGWLSVLPIVFAIPGCAAAGIWGNYVGISAVKKNRKTGYLIGGIILAFIAVSTAFVSVSEDDSFETGIYYNNSGMANEINP